ncbi:hypothetical protein LTR62_004779 [Meristemomyces frigidus]|uniref:Protein kinase domain-containing protein n=1 Tax=Meristemomyces frigidus TaxID=1508187 RepID=A0AAN7TG55_9PEZI|nr:hypothetical protein LTR62_004779 [Meristemomyces frigidus]
MPHLFPFVNHSGEQTGEEMHTGADRLQRVGPRRRPSLLKGLGGLLRRHHEQLQDLEPLPQTAPIEQQSSITDYFGPCRRRSLEDIMTVPRRVIPSLPRPQTICRAESEKREKLELAAPSPNEHRTLSVDQRRGLSGSAARRPISPRPHLPFVTTISGDAPDIPHHLQPEERPSDDLRSSRGPPEGLPPLQIPDQPLLDADPYIDYDEPEADQLALREECNSTWILNLSMHFRDKSPREKFFVTYAEKPNKWRRLTLSLDYRDAPPNSLEADLSTLHYQRDKSLRIYDAIRESLPEIQYYDTITNLKLETTREDCQLHVHVREDANEIITYPAISLFAHVSACRFRDSQVEFISHLSGFVYKVLAGGTVVIKKEIPGPDAVEEFLYEVNALHALRECENVVQLEGLVTDDSGSAVKGLLISYASQGALVDMLFDFRGTAELPWYRREKWAQQIVRGLMDIHEEGFVQGDFTLSNVVLDSDDNAVIIDINRRGCPVGWEPPELGRLIESGQRIGMHIGIKTDLFQLGMVLWALAEEVDEPERIERPLPRVMDDVPEYFQRMIDACLSESPRDRIEAKKLLRMFPTSAGRPPSQARRSVDFGQHIQAIYDSVSTHRSDKEYIDPELAVTIDEVRRPRPEHNPSDFTSAVTYVDPDSNPASSYRFTSTGSWVDVEHRRGRSPVSSRRRRSSPHGRSVSSATSVSPGQEEHKTLLEAKLWSKCSPSHRTEMSQYPPTINDDDLLPNNTVVSQAERACDRPLSIAQEETLNKQLQAVQLKDPSWLPLSYTDSGCDEQMTEDLNGTRENVTTKNDDPPSLNGEHGLLVGDEKVPDQQAVKSWDIS